MQECFVWYLTVSYSSSTFVGEGCATDVVVTRKGSPPLMLILYPGHAFEEGKDNLLRRILSIICIHISTVPLTVIVSSLTVMMMAWHPLQLLQGLVTPLIASLLDFSPYVLAEF